MPIINNAPAFAADDVCKPINTSLPGMDGSGSRSEDIALARSQGLEVDDYNEPAPENVPAEGVVIDTTSNLHGQTWGWGRPIPFFVLFYLDSVYHLLVLYFLTSPWY